MKRVISILAVLVVLIALAGCSGQSKKPIPQDGTIVFKSHPTTPGWVYTTPDPTSTYQYFIGVSQKTATEQAGRDDAYNHAVKGVVKYLGTAFKQKLEKIQVSYGLSSDVVNPTTARRGFEQQLTKGLANRVKTKAIYLEKWQKKDGSSYFLVRALTRVPIKAINGTYKKQLDDQIDKLKKKRAAARDARARAQFTKALDAFKKAKASGLNAD